MSVRNINLPDVVGKGYGTFWRFKGRYTVVKGSRGSKKSKTMALWIIYMIMKFPLAHALVIRQYWNTHKDSTFADLQWAARRLGVAHLFKFPKSEVKITYMPTGQTILFRGCDDPDSITSISVPFGAICFVWFEEAFQIQNEEVFDKIDGSIRGGFIDENGNEIGVPEGYFRRIFLTFNPWSPNIWIKDRFFRDPMNPDYYQDEDILAMTTDYRCNEWLDEGSLKLYNRWKEEKPRYYQVAGLGHWGITEGLIYDDWSVLDFDWVSMALRVNERNKPYYKKRYGLDFGYSNDPTAAIALLVDDKLHEIYVYFEHYQLGETNMEICEALENEHLQGKAWVADCSEPKSIAELFNGLYDEHGQLHRLSNIRGSKKGRGSILAGIQKIQDYHIYVHPKCQNTIIELSNYSWQKDELTGRWLNKPVDDFNHAMDAMRYACEDIGADSFTFF